MCNALNSIVSASVTELLLLQTAFRVFDLFPDFDLDGYPHEGIVIVCYFVCTCVLELTEFGTLNLCCMQRFLTEPKQAPHSQVDTLHTHVSNVGMCVFRYFIQQFG